MAKAMLADEKILVYRKQIKRLRDTDVLQFVFINAHLP